MKDHCWFPAYRCAKLVAAFVALAFGFVPSGAGGGQFTSSFASPPVNGVTLYGSATYTGGALQLTPASTSQIGAAVISDLDEGVAVDSLSAHVRVFIGGGSGADGFSLNFGSISNPLAIGEEGVTTGLAVSLDTFDNGGGDVSGRVEVKYNGASVASSSPLTLRTGSFVDLDVSVQPGGVITVHHNQVLAINAVTITGWAPAAGWQFAFGARTGGLTDVHSIDNLVLATWRSDSFKTNFNSPPVTGVNLFGNAAYSGGAVSLTTTSPGGQLGSMVINEIDPARAISSFAARIRLLIGNGSGADGFSFNFGNVPNAAFGEEGAGQGLIISLDTYDNGGGDIFNRVEARYNGSSVASSGIRTLRTGTYVDFVVIVTAAGRLSVAHSNKINDTVALVDVAIPGWAPQAGWRFGLGARTGGLTDDHFVDDLAIDTFACGNGSVETGEQCDDGNVAGGDCCALNCQLDPNGTPCTDDGNECTFDRCDGNGTCLHPANEGAICSDEGNPCTADLCDAGGTCVHIAGNPGALCRPAAGVCDIAESCDGLNSSCPADAKSTAQCRPPVGVCDLAEFCDGLANDCPADAKSSAVCRSAVSDCDAAELCDGVSNHCPADAKKPAGSPCSDGDACTVDACDGVTDQCQSTPATIICGDGNRCGTEFCDDGNMTRADGCSLRCERERIQNVYKANCIVQLNRSGVLVARAQAKVSEKCLVAAANGDEPDAQACLTADPLLKVMRAKGKTNQAEIKFCNTTPDFGYVGATVVNTAAQDEMLALVSDLFGANLTSVVIPKATDVIGATCQRIVLRAAHRIAHAQKVVFNRCKKGMLKGKPEYLLSSTDLETFCFDAIEDDLKQKVSKAVTAMATEVSLKCEGVDSTTAFPGFCSAASNLSDCVRERVNCRVCRMFNTMDGTMRNCDLFDDGSANMSCNP